jgi:hypothetical protein
MRERVSSDTWWSEDLIATTNTRREPPLGPYTCRERAIAPVADHALIPLWDTTVLPQLVHIVDDLGMDLTHLDFCRLYRPTGQEILVPVVEEAAAFHVIYVGVTKGSVSRTTAETFLDRCEVLLHSLNVEKVYTQVHESEVLLKGAQFFPNEPYSWILNRLRPFETSLQLGVGMNITTRSKPGGRGTGGVFLRIEGHDSLFLLTAGHILSTEASTELRFDDGAGDGERVDLFGPDHFKSFRTEVNNALRMTNAEIDQFDKWIRRLVGDEDPHRLVDRRRDQVRKREALETLIKRIDQPEWSDGNRGIGQVKCYIGPTHDVQSPSTSGSAAASSSLHLPYTFTEDWGLVELDPECLSHQPEHINSIPLKSVELHHLDPECIARRRNRGPDPSGSLFKAETPVICKDTGSFQIKGIAPVSSLNLAPITVMKRGAATGVTFGVASPVRSLVRSRNLPGQSDHVDRLDTLAIPIYGRKETRFASEGDSGSAVVDEKGRVVAILWGGRSEPYGLDVSYAQPVEFVLNQMRIRYGLVATLA